ncbi:hypothetical protein I302_102102 [Kwoniella bestiolae CBS 10118]|uniref:FAD-binding FR-type domain-containing protein n=1 Tax=Kwoniella bestiolae CBS 10118 TaxID=1296100 RepID=A0A1B9GE56_9TREE|nr:hypothetical protein I302_00790 [Kwoniella bestiolae CBS 10118]OCF29290.1 hypothetical protein I302_00790 [Kwoniella bestiolae CBS 10118]
MIPLAPSITSLLIISSALLRTIKAEGIQISLKNPAHNCVEGINDALTQVTFGDIDPNATYYGGLCGSVYHTTSLAMSTMKWCKTQKEQDAGWKQMSGYCEEYGDTILPSWQELLAEVDQTKVMEDINTIDPAIMGTVFDNTIVLSEEAWRAGQRTDDAWTTEENYHHGFGWGLYILVGLAILVGTMNRIFAIFVQSYGPSSPQETSAVAHSSSLRGRWYTLYRKHIELPALFGYKHSQASAWGFLSLPTRLQGLFIFAYVALNIVFTVVGYDIFYENVYWYGQRDTQIIRYLSDRTGIMCFYNLPLLWCLAGRNDVILWMTGWSYSTLNLFHRWVARIAVLQAIVHSAGYTWLERGYIAEEMKERYWWTGVIATIVMSLLIPFSVRPFREKFYELFLMIHIGLALVTLVTCWYHVEIWDGAYDPWIWASVAVWAMDRFIRVIRVIVLTYKALGKSGHNTIATIPWSPSPSSTKENGLIRLSITTSTRIVPQPGQYYFIYTPYSLKPWENHPFTLASWGVNQNDTTLNFLVAPLKGATRRWQGKILQNQDRKIDLRLLLEGPYGHTNLIERFDRVLFVVGGSGITSILPYLYKLRHLSIELPEPTVKSIRVVWIIKSRDYARDVLDNEMREYLEMGHCGSIPIKIDLYLTKQQTKEEGQSVASLEYIDPAATSSPQVDLPTPLTEKPDNLPQDTSSAHSSNPRTTPELKSSALNDKAGTLTIHQGRPSIREIIQNSVNDLIGSERLAVSACGPAILMDDTRSSVCEMYGNGEGQVGGNRIEYFEESFCW